MLDIQDRTVTVAEELDAARRALEAAREVLQRARAAHGDDSDTLRQAAARIDRIAAEVARIERLCADQLPAASEVRPHPSVI